MKKPPDGYTWSGRRLTRKQKTSRPDTLWPEIWKKMSDASKRKEKQKWVIENRSTTMPKKLGGIYFIDKDDEEFKNIMKNARKKLKVPMPAATPCKIQLRETCRGVEKKCKTKYACVVESDDYTRKRRDGFLHKYHEDHIAGKGMISLSHNTMVRKFILMHPEMKIPDATAAMDKEWEKLENIPAWQLTKVRNKKEVIAEVRNKGNTVQFASLMDRCHLKNSELEPQFQKIQGSSFTPR